MFRHKDSIFTYFSSDLGETHQIWTRVVINFGVDVEKR